MSFYKQVRVKGWGVRLHRIKSKMVGFLLSASWNHERGDEFTISLRDEEDDEGGKTRCFDLTFKLDEADHVARTFRDWVDQRAVHLMANERDGVVACGLTQEALEARRKTRGNVSGGVSFHWTTDNTKVTCPGCKAEDV